jgi:hypothetical protein
VEFQKAREKVELIFENQNSITRENCIEFGIKEYEEKFYKKLIKLGTGLSGKSGSV